jgi:hypothetical protein
MSVWPSPPWFILDPQNKDDNIVNPPFMQWEKKDQFFLSWINSTLFENMLVIVYGLTTACQVWTSLATKFANQSRSSINNLKLQIQSLQQGTKTCSGYLHTTKLCANPLSLVGKPVDDEDLISFIISSLNPDYNTFITSYSFATRDTLMTFNYFQAELLSYKALIGNQNPPPLINARYMTFFTQKHGTAPQCGKKKLTRPPKNSATRFASQRNTYVNKHNGNFRHLLPR